MKLFGIDTDNISLSTGGFATPHESARDWRILLTTALIILTALVSFSVWIFIQVNAGEFTHADASTSAGSQSVTLDREQLNQAVANFQKQRATYDLLRDRQPNIPNPAR